MIYKNITRETLRARVTIGDLVKETPYVRSFSINRTRGNISASFTCVVRLKASELSQITTDAPTGDLFNDRHSIIIEVSVDGEGYKKLFTGLIKRLSIRKDYEFYNSYFVDLSGVDVFQVIEGRTFTRRIKNDGVGPFAVITGLFRKALLTRGGGLLGSVSSSTMGRYGGQGKSPGGTQDFLHDNISCHNSLEVSRNESRRIHDRGTFNRGTGFGSGTSTTTSSLQITPEIAIAGPGDEVSFSCTSGCTESSTDLNKYTWSVSDGSLGKLIDGTGAEVTSVTTGDPSTPIVYRHKGTGSSINILTLEETENPSVQGTAKILGLPVHDHSDVSKGGPAYGVYAVTEST